MLNTLRGGKFALDVAAVGGSLAAGGIGWQDFIIVPLVASLTHQLVELLGRRWWMRSASRRAQRQQELLKQHLSGPMAEWLTKWPATGGSAFERLQQALGRIPGARCSSSTRGCGLLKS